ncbi:MAG: hypothetical protein ACO1SV_06780 [Fimbriimonas sp.]
MEQTPEVFQGEQRRMRRLLVIGLTKAHAKPAKVVDREAKAVADRAKLVSLVTRS